MEETVTITKQRLQQLERTERKMQCLMEAGIDNTDAYSEGMVAFHKIADPNSVQQIYDRCVADIGYDAAHYGPGHIVWDDGNLETEHIQFCIDQDPEHDGVTGS